MCLQSLATIPLQEEDWFYSRCQHTFELVFILFLWREGYWVSAVEVQVDEDSAQVEYDRFYHNGDKGTQSFGNGKPLTRSAPSRIEDRDHGPRSEDWWNEDPDRLSFGYGD